MIENFACVPDGPCTTMSNSPRTGPGVPTVRNGFLSVKNASTFAGGSYHVHELDRDVSRLGAKFALTPSSAGGGLFAMSIQEENIALTSPSVPRSSFHLYLEAGYWHVDVNDVAGTDVDQIVHRSFASPLVTDGITLHRIEVRLNRELRECEIDLPDGKTVNLAHPLFGLPGRFAYVEPFKVPTGNQSALANALVREWWVE